MPGMISLIRRRILWAGFAAVIVPLACAVCCAAVWKPAWRYADLQAARAAMRRYDYARAVELLANLNALGAPTPETLFEQGRALRRQGKLAAAGDFFYASLEAGGSRAEIHLQSLLARAQAGDVKAVEDELLALTRSRLDDDLAEECYEAMAQGFMNCMRPTDAAECVRYWKEWQAESPLPWYWEGVVFEGQEAWQQALESYAKAVALAPGHYQSRLGLARMELETARSDEAERLFSGCYADVPGDPEAVLGLAACLVNRGAREEATHLLRDALCLDLEPHQAALALAELGQMNLEAGEDREAAEMLWQAAELDLISPRIRLILASALARTGQDGEAESQRAAGRALSEKQVEMTNIVRRIRRNPDNADLRAEAGAMFVGLGMNREAVRWYETAVQIDPWHDASRRALIRLASEAGDSQALLEHSGFLGDARSAEVEGESSP